MFLSRRYEKCQNFETKISEFRIISFILMGKAEISNLRNFGIFVRNFGIFVRNFGIFVRNFRIFVKNFQRFKIVFTLWRKLL